MENYQAFHAGLKRLSGTVAEQRTALQIADTIDWSSIANKPLTFPPSLHGHSGADITSGTISDARLPSSLTRNFSSGNNSFNASVPDAYASLRLTSQGDGFSYTQFGVNAEEGVYAIKGSNTFGMTDYAVTVQGPLLELNSVTFNIPYAPAFRSALGFPSLAGQSGKYLTTNGSTLSFGAIDLSTKQDASAFLTTLSSINATSGSGALARVVSPTFTTPNFGAATGTSLSVSGVIQSTTNDVIAGAALKCAGNNLQFTSGGSASIVFGNQGRLRSTADGKFCFDDNTNNGFNLLQFGDTTSSFPALKRSGTTLAVVLADDSGPAPWSAAKGTFNGAPNTDFMEFTTTSAASFMRLYQPADASGVVFYGGKRIGIGNNYTTILGQLHVESASASTKTFVARQASSQSVNVFESQSQAGGVEFSVSPGGAITASGNFTFSGSNPTITFPSFGSLNTTDFALIDGGTNRYFLRLKTNNQTLDLQGNGVLSLNSQMNLTTTSIRSAFDSNSPTLQWGINKLSITGGGGFRDLEARDVIASGTVSSVVPSTSTTHLDMKVTGSASAFKVDSTYASAGFSHATIYCSGQATWNAGIGHVFIGDITSRNIRSYAASGTDNLGTSGYRWANVYAVNGDFTGTIGFSQSRFQQPAAQTLQTQVYDTTLAAWQESTRSQASSSGVKWSVFGAPPVLQPAAIANTSGAVLGFLEMEVNKIKDAIRSLGLIAT